VPPVNTEVLVHLKNIDSPVFRSLGTFFLSVYIVVFYLFLLVSFSWIGRNCYDQ